MISIDDPINNEPLLKFYTPFLEEEKKISILLLLRGWFD